MLVLQWVEMFAVTFFSLKFVAYFRVQSAKLNYFVVNGFRYNNL